MTQAEIDLLPKVAAIVGWPEDIVMGHHPDGRWQSGPRWFSDDEMSDRMARRIADWIDGKRIEYRRFVLRGDGGIDVWLIGHACCRGATRLEAEERAVLAWKEANP